MMDILLNIIELLALGSLPFFLDHFYGKGK